MAQTTFEDILASAIGNQTAVANSTTETVLFPSYQIPANYVYQGKLFRLTARGVYSTTLTPTITFGVRLGTNADASVASNTLLAATAALTTASGVTTQYWEADVLVQVNAIGSSGTWMTTGTVLAFSAASTSSLLAVAGAAGTNPVTATVSTIQANNLGLTAKWGTASASNTITCVSYTVEELN